MAPKIGVLMGGRSAEREVSLRTGEAVCRALIEAGYNTVKIDVGSDLVERLKEEGVELAFLALHGRYGEDGTIQGLLEMLDIPYTGPGVLASALAIDKIATKKILLYEGLPTPRFMQVTEKEALSAGLLETAEKVLREMGLPLVVKAPTQGSTIGTSFVHERKDVVTALELAYRYDRVALVEQFIEGMEVTAPVLGNDNPVALPLIEIVSATGVYDYEAKYTAGMSDHIIPPRIPGEQQAMIKELAVRTFQALGCRGLSRVDFMVEQGGGAYILEFQTLPGLRGSSFPNL
jgi:D-alanine-D-alanine ligase